MSIKDITKQWSHESAFIFQTKSTNKNMIAVTVAIIRINIFMEPAMLHASDM